jgi:hypothetical protein
MKMRRFRFTAAILMTAFMAVPEPSLMPRPVSSKGYSVRAGANRRGRPRKFSRPSRAITLTLPEDTIAALRAVDRDISRAVVRVVQPLQQEPPRSPAELAEYGNRAVIVVAPSRTLTERTGAELVPLADGRALLAFDAKMNAAQFELRLLDALADPELNDRDRETFTALADILGGTRRSGRAQVGHRNIIVFQGLDGAQTPESA